MGARRRPGRYVFLGVGLGVLALAIAGGTWLAMATSPFEKVGSGLMTQAGPGAPLVTYSGPGQAAEAVLWQPTERKPLKVEEVQREYPRDDGTTDVITIRVMEDSAGNRWLAAALGSNPLIPSPQGSLYFFESQCQLYLVDARTLEVLPLTSWEYQGKSRPQLCRERGVSVAWAHWPLWTPNGEAVVFLTNRSGTRQLWKIDVASREETVLADWGSRACYPHFWADDGRLLMGRRVDQVTEYFLFDLKTGNAEELVSSRLTTVFEAPYIMLFDGVPLTRGSLYDVNRRTTAPLPLPPPGYFYQLPYRVSPNRERIALWIANQQRSHFVAVIDCNAVPLVLRTYPAPGRAWSSGWLVWLDDDTLAIQTGGKNDPAAAMYALKVGEGK
ncbi:MAG: hypothetical protein K6T75_08890 [Acetobacteraceae bacterium]|nr:hypothetical protein [Acetobacteraceae bacterium]